MVVINIALDESGNFGTNGKYIVVGGIQYKNSKPIKNFMKNSEKKFRNMYPDDFSDTEIKHYSSYPAMRYYYCEKITEKTEYIHYCIANKDVIDVAILEDENILYNYMVYRIVHRVITQNSDITELNLLLDRRTIKLDRLKGIVDYIKSKVYFDLNKPTIKINITMMDSHESRVIQAADFIAGAIYKYYTHDDDLCYNLFKKTIDCCYHYPYYNFKGRT